MKSIIKSLLRKALTDERGQVLPLIALGMVGMLGAGGMSIDVGRAYVAHAQLQNYANAAVLAAAGMVYNTSSTNNATAIATQYGASNGNKNVNGALGTVTTTVSTICLNLLEPVGSSCVTGAQANAVRVVERATVPTTFMRMFGKKQLNVAATATASMQGQAQPWNVAIIVDATMSMSTADTNCGSGVTEFQCALNGIKALLRSTNPCKLGAASCSNADANFHVALFSFPPVATDTGSFATSAEANCSSYAYPTFTIYTLPDPASASYKPLKYQKNVGTAKNPSLVDFTSTYEVTYGAPNTDDNGFLSDYYDATQTNGLNPSSSIVKAISKCMQPNNGNTNSGTGGFQHVSQGGTTYYTSVLYAAQAALTAEAKAYPGTNNAIIFLSDGQANMVSAGGDFVTSPFTGVTPTTPPNPAPFSGLNTLTGTGLYPDGKDDCQQAIIAAQQAAQAGTTVFSVAYGSQQQGCTSGGYLVTDTTTLAASNYPRTLNASFSIPGLTPCVTMENIASSLNNFYSDYNQSGSGSTCTDAAHTVTSLADIFLSIGASFTQPRLIPNNAT